MKFVEIEGIDACGKTTLVQDLLHHYSAFGDVLCLKFPDYGETETGKLIRGWLGKEWTTGDFYRDALIHQSLQIVNRLDHIPPPQVLDYYNYILVDRYYTSTLVYGSLDGLPLDWLKKVTRWLPQPTVSILLDIDAEESFRRKPVRGDRYEEKRDHIGRVVERYREIYADGVRRKIIKCGGKSKAQVLSCALEIIG